MKIVVLQHVPFETAGMIADWALAHGHAITVCHLYTQDPLPDIAAFDMLVVMGGPMSVGDEAKHPWLAAEKTLLRAAIAAEKFVLGICLGAQLIASALGAKVYPHRVKEIGWFPVAVTDQASGHPLLSGLSSAMSVFHWHGDTFDLPRGALLLLSSAACAHQAFLYTDRVLALQFHLEMTQEGIERIMTHCHEEIVPGNTIQSEERLRANTTPAAIAACRHALHQLLDRLTEPSHAARGSSNKKTPA